jgi:hypothetical protein
MVEYIVCRYEKTGCQTGHYEVKINFNDQGFDHEDLLKMAEHFELAIDDNHDAIVPKEDLHHNFMYAYLTCEGELVLYRNPDMRLI